VSEPLRPLRDLRVLEEAMTAPLAVLYKHSTRCGVSSGSLIEMRQFAERHPDIPVYIIDVVADRDVAQLTADATGVRHESPQVLLTKAGVVLWSTAHFGVSCRRLERALGEQDAPALDGRASARSPEGE
jgi:bacillithiol system protein YtxJ